MLPLIPNCHNCGSPLSKTALEAFVPVCDSCGTPMVGIGGKLGLTSAFEREDPVLRWKMIDAALQTCLDQRRKYNDMVEACNEQLMWDARRYASIPAAPDLLQVTDVPPLGAALTKGLASGGCFLFVLTPLLLHYIYRALFMTDHYYRIWLLGGRTPDIVIDWRNPTVFSILLIGLGLSLLVGLRFFWSAGLSERSRIIRSNADRPSENERRRHQYDGIVAAALREGAKKKAAEDHRLRRQIAELEGMIRTTHRTEKELRQALTRA